MSRYAAYQIVEDAFSGQELDTICAIGDAALEYFPDERKAKVSGKRNCELTWIERGADFAWVHQRMTEAAMLINMDAWQFQLSGIVEPLQYALYNKGDFFDWHIDMREGTPKPRKLSLSLLLSHEIEYSGGNLELSRGESLPITNKQRGNIIAFPSYTMHRVAPIEKGTRRSLVAWAAGPSFC